MDIDRKELIASLGATAASGDPVRDPETNEFLRQLMPQLEATLFSPRIILP